MRGKLRFPSRSCGEVCGFFFLLGLRFVPGAVHEPLSLQESGRPSHEGLLEVSSGNPGSETLFAQVQEIPDPDPIVVTGDWRDDSGAQGGRQLTFDDNFWDGWINWSPDGARFIFHRFKLHVKDKSERHYADELDDALEYPGNGEFAGIWEADLRTRRVRRLLLSGYPKPLPLTDATPLLPLSHVNTRPSGLAPRYSPDGKQIAYIRVRRVTEEEEQAGVGEQGISSSVVLYTLKTHQTRVIAREESQAPTWSPDGRKVCYLKRLKNQGWVYFVWDSVTGKTSSLALPQKRPYREEYGRFIDKSEVKTIFVYPGPIPKYYKSIRAMLPVEDPHPAWSPDGKWVAIPQTLHYSDPYDSRGDMSWDRLWMARADGKGAVLLLKGDALTTRIKKVEWAPDGKWIAFAGDVAERGFTTGVYRLELSGQPKKPFRSTSNFLSRQRALIHIDFESLSWDMSSNGRWIVFSAWKEIAVARVGGTRCANLFRGSSPVWSPKGDRIAFIRNGHVFVQDMPKKYWQ